MNCNYPMALAECNVSCRNCGLSYGWDLEMSRVDVELEKDTITIKEKEYETNWILSFS